MTRKLEWALRMAFGFVALAVWSALGSPVRSKFGLWLLSHAGFYAFDTGCAGYCERVREGKK